MRVLPKNILKLSLIHVIMTMRIYSKHFIDYNIYFVYNFEDEKVMIDLLVSILCGSQFL